LLKDEGHSTLFVETLDISRGKAESLGWLNGQWLIIQKLTINH